MKLYEKPMAEIVDFTAEKIMDGEGGTGVGPSGLEPGIEY